jgi:hypothetical protein
MVYLIAHPGYGAAKVGIGRIGGRRLEQHVNAGWQVVFTVECPGIQALDVERQILAHWRGDLGLPHLLGPEEMLQGGWTETVDLDAIDTPVTIVKIKELAAT